MKFLKIAICLVLGISLYAFAGAPQLINYQGQISLSDTPVNGNHKVIFKIYNSISAGTLLWAGDAQDVSITNSVFSCFVGERTAPISPVQFSNINWAMQETYLEVWFDSELLGPREKMTSAAYSLYAKTTGRIEWTSVQNTPAVFPPDFPAGVVMMWGLAAPPAGWLLCDGSAVSRTGNYDKLFIAIGTLYGVGDGSTTFNIPNFKGRDAVGAGQGAGLTLRNTGTLLGEENHIVSAGEMPVHTHVQNAHSHTMQYAGNHNHGINAGAGAYALCRQSWPGESTTVNATDDQRSGTEPDLLRPLAAIPLDGNHIHTIDITAAVNQNAGSGGGHNNMQPSAVCNYIIKY